MSLIKDFFDTYINNIFVIVFMGFISLIAMFFKLKPEVEDECEEKSSSCSDTCTIKDSSGNVPVDSNELLKRLDEIIRQQQATKLDLYYDQLITMLKDIETALQSIDQKLYALTVYAVGMVKQIDQQNNLLENLQNLASQDITKKAPKKLDDVL